MSHKSFRLVSAAVLLTVASALTACGSSTDSSDATPGPLSGTAGNTSHPEWSQYTFTLGDNGGDGSEELAKITGAFDDAPYKVKFARFDYGPPLVQAAASGDIDLGYVGDRPADHRRGEGVRLQDRRHPTRLRRRPRRPRTSSCQRIRRSRRWPI